MAFKASLLIGAVLAFCPHSFAETLASKVQWGGFIDGQYGYDFTSPPNGDRSFTTQPARSNEFNLNLGFIEAKIETAQVRGRIALQAGTSVQSNYAAEPQKGVVSGPTLARHIQEARVGYRIGEATWIDGGIFLAHVGAETFISRDNLTLTRSLVADFSPYYLSGIKLNHAPSKRLALQLLVTNGWQNISENNSDKNIGTGVEYSFDSFSIAYNTMVGNEVSPDLQGASRSGQFRHFHDFIIKSKNLEAWELLGQLDIGFQRKADRSDFSDWFGTTLQARYSISKDQKVSIRADYYRDNDQIIVVSGRTQGFNGGGGSVGFDQSLEEGIMWRTEYRYLMTTDDIFPSGASGFRASNSIVTTSLAMNF